MNVYWTRETVIEEFNKACQGRNLKGVIPRDSELQQWYGGAGLSLAIRKQFGSKEAFAHAVCLRTQKEERQRKKALRVTRPKFTWQRGRLYCDGCHWRRDGSDVCVLPACFARVAK